MFYLHEEQLVDDLLKKKKKVWDPGEINYADPFIYLFPHLGPLNRHRGFQAITLIIGLVRRYIKVRNQSVV